MSAPKTVSGYNGGYIADPSGADAFARSLRHGGRLRVAAPHLMGDGEGMDLMPYLAFYETEIKNGDGSVWKAKGLEPPYIGQVGNNCTSRGDQVVMDLLQCLEATVARPGEKTRAVPYRTACEATYAFSLAEGNMVGDQGCTGFYTAKSATSVGRVSYKHIDGPDEEDPARLQRWARDPQGVTRALKATAEPFRLPEPVQIKSADEARSWLANTGLITIASGTGFEAPNGTVAPRDARGIVEPRGRWMHQMAIIGYICSDGIETFVIAQSWGPNVPAGPAPFRLPSFAFRARVPVVHDMLSRWNDSWGHRVAPGFERAPLPRRYTGVSWSG